MRKNIAEINCVVVVFSPQKDREPLQGDTVASVSSEGNVDTTSTAENIFNLHSPEAPSSTSTTDGTSSTQSCDAGIRVCGVLAMNRNKQRQAITKWETTFSPLTNDGVRRDGSRCKLPETTHSTSISLGTNIGGRGQVFKSRKQYLQLWGPHGGNDCPCVSEVTVKPTECDGTYCSGIFALLIPVTEPCGVDGEGHGGECTVYCSGVFLRCLSFISFISFNFIHTGIIRRVPADSLRSPSVNTLQRRTSETQREIGFPCFTFPSRTPFLLTAVHAFRHPSPPR